MAKLIMVSYNFNGESVAFVEAPARPIIGDRVSFGDGCSNATVYEVVDVTAIYNLYPQDDDFTFMHYVATVKLV